MFSDLSDEDKKDFNDTVEAINIGLCKGQRKFCLQQAGRENVIVEIFRVFSEQRWTVLRYDDTIVEFKSNLQKVTDNKPADLRSIYGHQI